MKSIFNKILKNIKKIVRHMIEILFNACSKIKKTVIEKRKEYKEEYKEENKKHKTKVDKYMNKYIEKNSRKKYNKKQKIIFICILAIAIISFVKFKPVQTARTNLYKGYEEYRVEMAKEKAKKDKEKKKKKKNTVSYAYYGKYPVPIKGTITSNYGYRTLYGKSDFHTGIDISGKHRDKVISIADGVVTFAGSQNGYGNCIEIRHDTPDGTFYTFYAHLSKIYVSKWQAVIQSEVIGLEGGARTDPNPGFSTGHHLHFEVRKKSGYGNHINPYNYIF